MPSEEHYNDTESNYFLLFVVAVITFPSTYLFLKYKVWGNSGDADAIYCNCSLCKKGSNGTQHTQKKQKTSWSTIIQFSVLVLLWALFVYVAANINTNVSNTNQAERFDPYEILGLSYGASKQEIKQAYRTLSLIHHPDKAADPNDPAVQTKYINIVKANEALTDEIASSNWEKYGNPDGPQPYSVGIALPSWLVKKDNTIIVIGVYLSLLIVGLPAVVCCWWRSWKKYDSTKVMNSTMGLYYHKVEPLARVKVISELVSVSQEYQTIPIRISDEQNLTKVAKLVPDAHAMKKKPKYNIPYGIKVNALFYAQMSRLQQHLSLGLKEDLDTVLTQVRPLLGGFITISTAKGLLVPILETLLFLQMLTQSAWNKEDLLQLPYITRDILDVFNSKRKNCGELSRFASMTAEKRKVLLKEEGLNEAQIADVEVVLNYLPSNVHIKFDCKVEGEDTNKIVAKSVVTCFFKVYRGRDDDVDGDDDDDDDDGFFSSGSDEEQDEEAKKKRKELRKQKQQKKKKQEKEDAKKRYVHAPYFPEKREESWWIVIGDTAKSLLVAVHKVGCFGQKISGKVKFLAPEQPGTYNFTLHLICDGYLGCDSTKAVRIVVVRDDQANQAKVAQTALARSGAKISEIQEDESDFSDEDDDYISDKEGSLSGSESD